MHDDSIRRYLVMGLGRSKKKEQRISQYGGGYDNISISITIFLNRRLNKKKEKLNPPAVYFCIYDIPSYRYFNLSYLLELLILLTNKNKQTNKNIHYNRMGTKKKKREKERDSYKYIFFFFSRILLFD